LHFAWL